MIKLHLGCGQNYLDGWVNCDHGSHLRTDLCFDMDAEGEPWLIADNSVAEVLSNHNLEHCRNFLWVMSEMCRVCAPAVSSAASLSPTRYSPKPPTTWCCSKPWSPP